MTNDLTLADAVEILGVSGARVLELVADGLLPGSSQAADGTWRISGRALERLVEDRDLVANPPADNPYALPQSDGRSRRLPRG